MKTAAWSRNHSEALIRGWVDPQATSGAGAGSVVAFYLNNTVGALAYGDVVVMDAAADSAVKTITSAGSTIPVGVVQDDIAAGAIGPVLTQGIAVYVNVVASVTRGEYAETSGTAKKAQSAGSRGAGTFGVWLTGGTSPAAYLFGAPDLSSGGGGSMTVEFLDGSGGVGSVTVLRVGNLTNNGGGDVSLLPQIDGTGLGTIFFGSAIVQLLSPDSSAGLNISDGGNVGIFGDHTPGTGTGIDLLVGTNEVSVSVREQSSSRLQLVLDGSASYKAELADDGISTGSLLGRFAHLDDGGNASYPSLGMLRQFSSAPTAQFEGESYYDTTTHKAYTYDGTTWRAWW